MTGNLRAWLAVVALGAGLTVVSVAPATGATTTAPAAAVTAQAAGDPVIAAAGDIACDPGISSPDPYGSNPFFCQQRATSDLLVDQPLAAVLPLGDLQYEDATLDNFRKVYDPSWGRVKTLTKPVAGNHEYYVPGADGYFDYFGAAAGERGRGYYSYDIGAWHVVALNSNCTVVSCAAGSAQDQWLRADLAANPRDCTLAYFHHPYLGAQTSANQLGNLWRTLYNAGADVVLAGHEHNYQRFAPQDGSGAVDLNRGIRQFIVGTGGKNLTGSADTANRELFSRAAFGVLFMTLGANGYDWRFAGTKGESVDQGTSSCSPSTAPSSPSPSPAPASPSPDPSPSASTGPTCDGEAPTIDLDSAVVNAGQRTGLRVRADAGEPVEVWAYSRPSTTYQRVRSGTTGPDGTVAFSILTSTNTRLYAVQPGCAAGPSVVLGVRTVLTLAAQRVGPRSYVFSGDSLPARPGGLIVSLYRVEASGREVLTSQVRADALTGEWSLRRQFSGSGRFGFVVRTGQDLQNAPGSSSTRSLLVY